MQHVCYKVLTPNIVFNTIKASYWLKASLNRNTYICVCIMFIKTHLY